MEDIKDLISRIKLYTVNERKRVNLNKADCFFTNMLEISTSLTELGIYQGRKITLEEEESWFKGGYHLDFLDSELNDGLYKPLCEKIKELNFFR